MLVTYRVLITKKQYTRYLEVQLLQADSIFFTIALYVHLISTPKFVASTQICMTSAHTVMTSLLMPQNSTGKPCKLKLAILGDKHVGKTSLLTRYVKGKFNPTYIHTTGKVTLVKLCIYNDLNEDV